MAEDQDTQPQADEEPQGTTTSAADTPVFEGITPEEGDGESQPRPMSNRRYSVDELMANPSAFESSRLLMAGALADAEEGETFSSQQVERRVRNARDHEVES